MAKQKLEARCVFNTVNDLRNALNDIHRTADATSFVLDSSVYGPAGEIFTGFNIVRRRLSDKSEVLDLEFFED